MRHIKFILIIFFLIGCSAKEEVTTKGLDIYTQEVLEAEKNYIDRLIKTRDTNERCRVIYGNLHTNTQSIFDALGRLAFISESLKDRLQTYTGKNDTEDVSNYIWPYIQEAVTETTTKESGYVALCSLIMGSASNYLLNKNEQYVFKKSIRSNEGNVIYLSIIDGHNIFVNWKKENGIWKLFSVKANNFSYNELPIETRNTIDKIIMQSMAIEAINDKCMKLSSNLFSGYNAREILVYSFNDLGEKIYKERSSLLNNEINKTFQYLFMITPPYLSYLLHLINNTEMLKN